MTFAVDGAYFSEALGDGVGDVIGASGAAAAEDDDGAGWAPSDDAGPPSAEGSAGCAQPASSNEMNRTGAMRFMNPPK
jgi:hypothetical protein